MSYKPYRVVNLSEVSEYINEKISGLYLDNNNYISTTNMIPNRGGINNEVVVPSQNVNKFIENDILISNIRPYFKKIWFSTFSGGASPDVLIIRANGEIVPKYLYYNLMADDFFEYSMKGSKGTKMPRGDRQHIMEYKIPIFSRAVQTSIVNFLSNLDNKIELNNKINNNLEDLAQTLYKHWFVDFEFPNEEGLPYKSSGGKMVESELGLIPEGWTVIELKDIIDYSNGYAFKSKDYQENGIYKVITIRNVKDGKFDLSNVSKVHEIPERIREDQILNIGDILMSLTGNVGRVAIVDEDNCLLNQRVAKISSLDSNYKGFIYFILRNNEIFNKIVSLGKGSAQQNLSPIEMLKIKMTLPKSVDNIVLNIFNTMFNILIHNQIENKKLTKLRDLLLPKLMSGEIRVPIKERLL